MLTWLGGWRAPALLLLGSLLLELLPIAAARTEVQVAVRNVRAELKGDRVEISYDLVAPAERPCAVRLEVRRQQDHTLVVRPRPEFLNGDTGSGVVPGLGKHVTWNMRRDVGQPPSEMVYIAVFAEVESGSHALYWIGGGVLLAGGILLLLLGKGSTPPPSEGEFPTQPGRPSK